MINLKNILIQMKDDRYQLLLDHLEKSNAEKFSSLVRHLREDKLSEEDIMLQLNINSSAYYTLKSRLYNRIGKFLSAAEGNGQADLLKEIAGVPELIYNSPKDTAIAVLTKMEKDLTRYDMPYGLSSVYSALKKLHVSSPKYYSFAQSYNRHMAYTMALDKAEDTLASFMRALGEYHSSREALTHEVLKLMKDEMDSLFRMYESHHLAVYKNILDVSFALFIPLSEAVKDDEPVEDILESAEGLMESHPSDTTYRYLKPVITLLYFEYYHQAGQFKKESQYYETTNNNIAILMNYNFCCFPSVFLISKINRFVKAGQQALLYDDNKKSLKDFVPDPHDVPNYLNYVRCMAASAFYSGKYAEAASLLNGLLNDIVFKNISHSEIEVKLFLVLCSSMQNKYDMAHTVLKSVTRKVRELETRQEYANAEAFIKMLSLQMDSNTKNREQKLYELRDKFLLLNRGRTRMLEYLDLNDAFIKQLAKSVK